MLFSLLFGFLTLTLVANQVATGLALTILGLGLSGMIGEAFIGLPGLKLAAIEIPASLGHPVLRTACCFQSGPDLLCLDPRGDRRQLVPVQEPCGAAGSAPSATVIPRRMRWGSRSCARAIWR
jgi:hypothetical protein